MKTRLHLGLLIWLITFVVCSTAHAQDPYAAIKKKYRCSERNVLCIDACTGDILASATVANALFMNTDADARIQVRVVGDCADVNVVYESSITYRQIRDTLTKQAASVAAASNAATTKSQTASFIIALQGDDSAFAADVEVKRAPVPAAAGGAPAALAAPARAAGSVLPVTNWTVAHAVFRLIHGRYYIDFGVGAAVALKRERTIAAAPYRGDAHDLRLTTETSTPITPVFSAFIYPFGHRRGTFSPFDSWGAHILSDMFVIQLATELSREDFLRTAYVGAGIEPVSGLNFVMGAAFVPISVYRSGARAGNSVVELRDLNDLRREVHAFRFYFAFSASTELLNAAKSAYTQVTSH